MSTTATDITKVFTKTITRSLRKLPVNAARAVKTASNLPKTAVDSVTGNISKLRSLDKQSQVIKQLGNTWEMTLRTTQSADRNQSSKPPRSSSRATPRTDERDSVAYNGSHSSFTDWLGNTVQPFVDVRAASRFYTAKANASVDNGYAGGTIVSKAAGLAGGIAWTLPKVAIMMSGFESAQTAGEAYADPSSSMGRKAWETAKVGLAAASWIAPLPAISGPGGLFFGRALIARGNDHARGFRGLFNQGHYRFGWSYNGARQANVLSFRAGSTHFDIGGPVLEKLYRTVSTSGLGQVPRFQHYPWQFVPKHL